MLGKVRTTSDSNRGPIDSGAHVGCMADGCGGATAIMWVDRFNPWLVVLCAEHGLASLPSEGVIATPVFFDDCPPELQQKAAARSLGLHLSTEAEG